MSYTSHETLFRAAAAIANARSGRRGMPPITNVLDLLPPHLRAEVFEDAAAAMASVGLHGVGREEAPVSSESSRDLAGRFMHEHGFRGMTPESGRFQDDLAALLDRVASGGRW